MYRMRRAAATGVWCLRCRGGWWTRSAGWARCSRSTSTRSSTRSTRSRCPSCSRPTRSCRPKTSCQCSRPTVRPGGHCTVLHCTSASTRMASQPVCPPARRNGVLGAGAEAEGAAGPRVPRAAQRRVAHFPARTRLRRLRRAALLVPRTHLMHSRAERCALASAASHRRLAFLSKLVDFCVKALVQYINASCSCIAPVRRSECVITAWLRAPFRRASWIRSGALAHSLSTYPVP